MKQTNKKAPNEENKKKGLHNINNQEMTYT